MPRITPEKLRKAQITLKIDTVFTGSRLVSILGLRERTAQTKLKQWQTYTSYNQNNKY